MARDVYATRGEQLLMYINPHQYGDAFLEIKRTSSSHSTCKLIIFVSCLDIDSICTGKILSIVFKKNLIQYQLIPIVGYTDLKTHYGNLDDDITNVVLIGCGAMIDLESFLDIDPAQFVVDAPHQGSDVNDDLHESIAKRLQKLRRKIYVLDGHRPWNLDNVFGSHMVVCFDDGYIDSSLSREKASYEQLTGLSEEELAQIEAQELEDEEDEDEESDGDDSDGGTRKRRKIVFERKRQVSQWEDDIDSYYNQGTTIITSLTATVYALLASIGEANLDNLWLSIIGTSSLDSHYPEVYDKIQPLFKEEVHRLNPSTTTDKTADTKTLTIEKDYHLFLLRHWTLYDAFFYSSHVNSKLNLWTEDGKKRLHKLFAKMGISLLVAQQKWLYMDLNIKKQLPVIFSKYLPSYGLEGIVRDGFVRTYGYAGQLSAMECVEALTALLECDRRLLQNPSQEQTGDEDEIKARIEQREKLWINNFWQLWDALNVTTSTNVKAVTSSINQSTGLRKSKGLDLLFSGLEHAKDIQQIIFKTGMSLLERKFIKSLRLYRLCVLNDGLIPDLSIFNNPLILAKLGAWLLDNITEIEFANFDEKNVKSLKPLVVASLDVASETYMVIGLAPKYPRGMTNSMRAKLLKLQNNGKDEVSLTTRLNTFSVAFQKVAASSGAKVRIDSFDSSVIEIRKDDLSPFLEKLTLSGLI